MTNHIFHILLSICTKISLAFQTPLKILSVYAKFHSSQAVRPDQAPRSQVMLEGIRSNLFHVHERENSENSIQWSERMEENA